MPYDQSYDDEEKRGDDQEGQSRRFKDFDCPDCAANNPYDDGFGDGDEVRCYYCGQEFRVSVSDAGKARFKEI